MQLISSRLHLIFTFCLLLPVACAGSLKPRSDKPSVSFELNDLEGKKHKLKDYTGKVVLLDLWATWCAPCKRALPVYSQFQKDFGAQGFQVIAVSLDENRQELDEFVKTFFKGNKPPFIILHDREAKLAEQIAPDTMPTSLIVNRRGKTVYFHSGFTESTDVALFRTEIEKALAQ